MNTCNCEECQCKKITQPEDIFNTTEFKSLSWKKGFWIRLQIAFFQTIRMS